MPQPSILILAPHTDDGELGCGATVARYGREGANLHYAAFSTCERSLPDGVAPGALAKEAKAATALLGIPSAQLTLFDYDVRSFKARRQDILDDMIRLRHRIAPDIVFLPATSDVHQDHQVIAEEGFRAFKYSTVYGYELPWNNPVFHCQAFVAITPEDLDRKVAALREYGSQNHRSYMSESFTRSLAVVRGTMAGTTYAEAFEVMRLFVR